MTGVILNIDLSSNGFNKLVANKKKLMVHFRDLANNFFASEKNRLVKAPTLGSLVELIFYMKLCKKGYG